MSKNAPHEQGDVNQSATTQPPLGLMDFSQNHRSTAKSRAFKAATFGLTWTFQRFWNQFSIFWKKTILNFLSPNVKEWWSDDLMSNPKTRRFRCIWSSTKQWSSEITKINSQISRASLSLDFSAVNLEDTGAIWWGTWLQIFDVEMVIKKQLPSKW